MPELDKWAPMKLNDLAQRFVRDMIATNSTPYSMQFIIFCVVDMSNFYLDVIKDRLYCDETDGLSRRLHRLRSIVS